MTAAPQLLAPEVEVIRFTVLGEPAPQGSKVSFLDKRVARGVLTAAYAGARAGVPLNAWLADLLGGQSGDSGKLVKCLRMKESASVGVDAWRLAVGYAAARTWKTRPPIDEPVMVNLEFWTPRHSEARKHTLWKPTMPDVDKLMRSTLDGLTQEGSLLQDDGRVVIGWYAKRAIAQRGDPTGCVIEIVRLGDLERAGYDVELTWRVLRRTRKTFDPKRKP